MPISSTEELTEYLPLYTDTLIQDDPLIYARFVSQSKDTSFYLLGSEAYWSYGFLINPGSCGLTYINTCELQEMAWDETFTPCPLSIIKPYITRL